MSSSTELIDRFARTLDGTAAVVTGAGSGIGRAVSIAFARGGADVALLGRRRDALEATAEAVSATGRRSVVLPVDVRDDDAVRSAVAAADEAIGPTGVAVANAGSNGWADVAEQSPDLVRNALEPGCVDTDWYPPGEDAPRDRMLAADDVAYVALFLATLPSSVVVEELMVLPRSLLVAPW